jgi:hypothetical protein
MVDIDPARSGLNRRGFLKSSAVTATVPLQSLLQEFESTSAKLYSGKTHLVESYLTHEGIEIPDYHTDGGDPSHIVLSDDNLVTVCATPVRNFRRNAALSFRRGFHSLSNQMGTTIPETGSEKKRVRLETDEYNSFTRSALLSENYSIPDWSVRPFSSREIRIQTSNKTTTIEAGDSTIVYLPGRKVKTTGGDVKQITPILTVKNHGELDVYSREDAKIFPRNSGNSWIDHRIFQYLNAAMDSSRFTISKTDDFVIVE